MFACRADVRKPLFVADVGEGTVDATDVDGLCGHVESGARVVPVFAWALRKLPNVEARRADRRGVVAGPEDARADSVVRARNFADSRHPAGVLNEEFEPNAPGF